MIPHMLLIGAAPSWLKHRLDLDAVDPAMVADSSVTGRSSMPMAAELQGDAEPRADDRRHDDRCRSGLWQAFR